MLEKGYVRVRNRVYDILRDVVESRNVGVRAVLVADDEMYFIKKRYWIVTVKGGVIYVSDFNNPREKLIEYDVEEKRIKMEGAGEFLANEFEELLILPEKRRKHDMPVFGHEIMKKLMRFLIVLGDVVNS